MLLFSLFGPRRSLWHIFIDSASSLYGSYADERRKRAASSEARGMCDRERRWVMATLWSDEFHLSSSILGANVHIRVNQMLAIQEYLETFIEMKHFGASFARRGKLLKLAADLERMKINIDQLHTMISESEQHPRVVPLL